jgi:PTS system nitrogen regulatory IIA component
MPMQNPASRRVPISELIPAAAIDLELTGEHREAVLAELVDLIPGIGKRPEARQTLIHALQEREQLHSTGIGDGVALPHARNAMVGLVDQPLVAFGRHEGGINYGAIDGAPAHLFFLLVAPTVTQHLGVLARLSRLLRNPVLRRSLLTVDSPQKVLVLLRDAESQG